MGIFALLIRLVRRFSVVALGVACVAVLWRCGRYQLRRPTCPSYGGFTHPDFEDVKNAYIQNILSGFDKGSSFAVYHNGEPLVDLWGGCADEGSAKGWEKDTLSQAWSTTKGVTAILLATLVDRGRLNIHQKVSRYWPEFSQNGKENITVGMLLSHQAGLPSLERQISLLEYRDNWATIEDMMAKQAPLWEPGKHYFYHALTWGMYADALVRKVDIKRRNVSQYFQEEIADKLDGLDFHIGLPRDQFYRSTRCSYIAIWEVFAEMFLTWKQWIIIPGLIKHIGLIDRANRVFHFMDNPPVIEDAELRSIGLPSANGFGNARSIARLFDFLANNGTVDGKTLLSKEAATMLSTSFTDNSEIMYMPRFPVSPLGLMQDSERLDVFGHRGYGGQVGYADIKRGIAVGYVTNFKETSGITEDPRVSNVLDVFYQCFDKLH